MKSSRSEIDWPSYLPEAPWPYYSDDEIEAVAGVLRSGKVNYWTGQETRQFEAEFAASVGCQYGIALANGTVALELAIITLGLEPGGEVIVTPRTFIASASAVILRGLKPVFADVDRESGNITAATIEPLLTKRTKAIVTVHLAGWPCDMEPILELARSRGIAIIEDCAQCHGATYQDKPCGSLGEVAAWSFCQDKIMTTGGEGGLLTTNQPELWERAWSYKDHGKSYDAVYNREHALGFRWLHESFGTNWRLTELQAALGRIQLTKLPDWIATRRRNAEILHERFAGLACLRTPRPASDIGHSYYKFYTYVQPERLKRNWSRDRLMAELTKRGLFCQTGSCSEIYLERAFAKAGLEPAKRLPIAQELGATSLIFQVHPTLSEQHMHYLADQVEAVCTEASR